MKRLLQRGPSKDSSNILLVFRIGCPPEGERDRKSQSLRYTGHDQGRPSQRSGATQSESLIHVERRQSGDKENPVFLDYER